MTTLHNFTLETLPADNRQSNRRHFSTLASALTAFHVQRCGGEHKAIYLWDNRAGEVIRDWKAT